MIFEWHRRLAVSKFTRVLLWSLALTSALSACGIKGPLYIPEKKYPQNVSVPQTKMHAQLHQLTVNS
jgi:predicted small lipoprotein YifL